MTPPAMPLRYHPSVETLEDGEGETSRELVATMRKIAETTYKDMGHAIRSVHAKSHGLLHALLEVPGGLPPVLAQGLFAGPGRYQAVMRFSTTPGDILDDSVSTPRGVAIKVIGVPGERLPEDREGTSQDVLMVDGPAFLAPSGKAFLRSVKLLAATTDKAEGLKKVLSAALRGVENLLEAVGTQSGTIKALGGQPETHILGDTFFTQAPIRYGDYIAKLSLVPVSPELKALTKASLNVNGKPNGLRDAVNEFFRDTRGEWELRVQLCTDLETMPVEDSSKVWPEDRSPFITVARLTAEPQAAWTDAKAEAVDDGMAFSPWHALAAHRPLGSIMRLRRPSYEMSAEFRSQRNRCPVREPRSLESLPR